MLHVYRITTPSSLCAFQNTVAPAAYLRHTYAYFTTITHTVRMQKSLLRTLETALLQIVASGYGGF
jgi:hypothetical protein